jgi:hypothetical protein
MDVVEAVALFFRPSAVLRRIFLNAGGEEFFFLLLV